MNLSHLTESNTTSFLFNTLKHCHENRVNIYYYVLNISVFVIFAGIASYVLYYCYTHKLSAHERERKNVKDQEYILSKIRYYQEEHRERNSSGITNLPTIR